VPADIFRCTDGWIVATVIGPAMVRHWCRMIGEEDWLADPRFWRRPGTRRLCRDRLGADE